jgi:hypothetical protein
MRAADMLTFGLEDFTWKRPAGRKKGFALEGSGDLIRFCSVPDVQLESYQPSKGLYREFACLSATPAAVLAFANRYGLLEQEYCPTENDMSQVWVSDWLREIRGMKRMVALADAVSAGDLAAIRIALGQRIVDRTFTERVIDPKGLSANEVAELAVSQLYIPLSFTSFNFCPTATWNSRTLSVDIRWNYLNLNQFMSWQMYISLIKGRRFQQCKACEKWFQLSPGVNRADRATCSPSCRFTLYRRRKQHAFQLREVGWSIKRIAKEVGSTVDKVKQWLASE